MPPDAAEIETENVRFARKVRLSTLEHLDRRTVAARRTNEFITTFQQELGGQLSPGLWLAVKRAALLAVLAEDATTRQLAGNNCDIDQVIRLCNAARRAVQDLGLTAKKRIARTVPGAAALREHLARRAVSKCAAET